MVFIAINGLVRFGLVPTVWMEALSTGRLAVVAPEHVTSCLLLATVGGGVGLYIKRVYEPFGTSDGFRVLVDRLWPRGLAKHKAGVDLWLRDVAPSDDLRKWFGHEPARWDRFRERYLAELQQGAAAAALDTLRERLAAQPVLTLLYAAHDQAHNNAVVLRDLLQPGD